MKNSVHVQRMLEEARTLFYAIAFAEGFAIGFERGRLKEARKILLRLGERRFGRPDSVTTAAIESTDSVDQIEGWIDLIDEVWNWRELLSEPPSRGVTGADLMRKSISRNQDFRRVGGPGWCGWLVCGVLASAFRSWVRRGFRLQAS